MKQLIKTDDYASLEAVDYGRVVYDTTSDKVFLQNIGGGVTYEYVDLGLPSQLKWAKYNIGATNEEEAGLYFQWGDTQGYTAEQVGDGEGLKKFDWASYKFSIDGSNSNFSKYNASDSKTVLDPEDDAAHVNMGGNWRMPTFEEYKELLLNTDIYLVPREGEENKHICLFLRLVMRAVALFSLLASTATCGLLRLSLLVVVLFGLSTSMRTTATSASATLGTAVFPFVGFWLSNLSLFKYF